MKSLFLLIVILLSGCTLSERYVLKPQPLSPGNLPLPDTEVSIANLGPCTDSPDRTLRLNSQQPITVLVHGCNGSAGRFRALAQIYAFHGQQAICYTYDDRSSLVDSAHQLNVSLDRLAREAPKAKLSIIGHSMGGLISRKAMEYSPSSFQPPTLSKLKLITVSAPIAGIAAAETCGSNHLHWLTLGIIPGICWLISGDNWNEIHAQSDFIQYPAPLRSEVERYLKVVTNEQGTCRRRASDGRCLESDDIFDVDEQYHPVVDSYPQLTNVQVDAGHVEIVGYKHVVPRKLISVLQREGFMEPTPPTQQAALEILLGRLY